MTKWKATVTLPAHPFEVEVDAASEDEAVSEARGQMLSVASVEVEEVIPPTPAYSSAEPPPPGVTPIGPSYFTKDLRDYLPDSIPTEANSAAMTRNAFQAQPTHSDNVDTNWGVPVYYGRAVDPRWTIAQIDSGQTRGYTKDALGKQLHIPADFRPAGGSDGSGDQNFNVWDQVPDANGQTWYWVFRLGDAGFINRTNRTLRVYRAVRHEVGSDFFSYVDEPPPVHPPLRADDLRADSVSSMSELEVYCVAEGPVGWFEDSSAQGRKPCATADSALLRFGDVLFLDMTDAEIDARNTTAAGKAFLRGLAHKGTLVARNGGNAGKWSVKFESSIGRDVNPWTGSLALPFRYGSLLSVSEWQTRMKVVRRDALPPRP
jgi:hypothetical protein